jgi:hypothetical protein
LYIQIAGQSLAPALREGVRHILARKGDLDQTIPWCAHRRATPVPPTPEMFGQSGLRCGLPLSRDDGQPTRQSANP